MLMLLSLKQQRNLIHELLLEVNFPTFSFLLWRDQWLFNYRDGTKAFTLVLR